MDEHGNIVQDPKLGWKTIPEGAATTIAAAFDPNITSKSWLHGFLKLFLEILLMMLDKLDQNGSYLVDCKVNNEAAEAYALDKGNAAKLWKLSEQIVGQNFHY